ncbi:MAG: hypothetical protein KGL74_12885 [Elusimicrobia bacterium]|nr:hypothetical protein [Elusimicrobiota bacterium]
MKKLLGSTLALAMLVPVGANAELLKNFKASGSLEVDAVSANNVKDFSTKAYDHLDTVQTRLMVHGDWDLLDDVHAHVSLTKNDRAYGTAHQSVNGAAGTSVLENTFVDESYIKIDKLFGGLDTTLGRQFYGEAGDLVIYYGPKYNLYGLPVTALDGARFDWNGEKVGVTVLASKVTGHAAGTIDAGDVNLMGLDLHAKPMDNVSGGAYVYNKTTVNSNATNGVLGNDRLYVAGLKGKVTMGGAWLKGEFAKDFGQNRTLIGGNYPYATALNYTGWAAKLNGGVKVDLDNLGALTGWGEAGVGSGGATSNRNFQAIAGDYRPGGIYGRFGTGASAALGSTSGAVDTNTLSNRVIFGAGVKATPAMLSKLTAGLSYWNYRAQSVAPSPNGNTGIGSEYDLDLSWAHSENVTVSAGVGSFQPGRLIRDAVAAVNPATLCYTDFSVKF